MPLCLLAGVPKPIGLRHRGYSPGIPGWEVIVLPSPLNQASVVRSWSAVLECADRAEEAGAHILGFHPRIQDRGEFEATVYGRHRLVWLDEHRLGEYGTEQFTDYIERILDFESRWREALRPSETRHALILPEPSFEPDAALRNAWARAQRVQTESDSLERVSALLSSLRARHYSDGVWQDRVGLVFDPGGPRHGEATREWRWKYTYLVPAQFHYDVRAVGNRGFRVRDRFGDVHSFREYTNVDCHGFVRGGR